ncbi:hypothetical protein Glove_89g48 [Diversispora epigaea]|uniref:Uncharacterized protein n=1 Tax=Diversispora epigaea TaxID=1348612 RepID=A0A397JA08_9GLOM|nr:hypothetical protein Glove_89g48 [Diversispora epigaea]
MSTEIYGKFFTRKENIPNVKRRKTKIRIANLCFAKIKILRFDAKQKVHIERFQDSPNHAYGLEKSDKLKHPQAIWILVKKETVKNYLAPAIVDAVKEYAAEKINLEKYQVELYATQSTRGFNRYGCWDVDEYFFISNEDSNTVAEACQHSSLLLQVTSTNTLKSYHNKLKKTTSLQHDLIDACNKIVALDLKKRSDSDYVAFKFQIKKISVTGIDDDILREIYKFSFPI